ncbi:ribosome modulation factor [Aestuariirhabdus sp. Z084]|uniref:ribosome modulation factor n=1 Tax=Aestuariirhabdus haliotis TaxID=2918751 RepID=UPI00201B3EB4|nr:ribosome modulation factor [Aestuariirhabdus haliotis]MCL6414623.1 ribosome modulation factor [Aestuariirhabdus haliotis]MCL6418395.1 ribosome modulation factor [Aestuariirhabdus haliotis]
MKRQKRDKTERAFVKGYNTGVTGKSRDQCPHDALEMRQAWLTGWREGRSDNWDGLTGVSGVHRVADLH